MAIVDGHEILFSAQVHINRESEEPGSTVVDLPIAKGVTEHSAHIGNVDSLIAGTKCFSILEYSHGTVTEPDGTVRYTHVISIDADAGAAGITTDSKVAANIMIKTDSSVEPLLLRLYDVNVIRVDGSSIELGPTDTTIEGEFVVDADRGEVDNGANSLAILGQPYVGNRNIGSCSIASGLACFAGGLGAHAGGVGTVAYGVYSHSEGFNTHAIGNSSHTEGANTKATESAAHAEGDGTEAAGRYSHAEGFRTKALASASHVEGNYTEATGYSAHAEGGYTKATGAYSHAEGYYSEAVGGYSHAEGHTTKANKSYSHAEGYKTIADGQASHAEGSETVAQGNYAHSEGQKTKATGNYSHAEGNSTQATGSGSHAEGHSTIASSSYAHAEGQGTKATALAQHVQGKYNRTDSNMVDIVGWGSSDTDRKNIYELDKEGNAWFAGDVYVKGTNGKGVKLEPVEKEKQYKHSITIEVTNADDAVGIKFLLNLEIISTESAPFRIIYDEPWGYDTCSLSHQNIAGGSLYYWNANDGTVEIKNIKDIYFNWYGTTYDDVTQDCYASITYAYCVEINGEMQIAHKRVNYQLPSTVKAPIVEDKVGSYYNYFSTKDVYPEY